MESESAINRTVQNFISAAKGLRQAINADIPIQQVMILVYLWNKGDVNQVELIRALDLKKAAASRHCRSLSSYTNQKDGVSEEKGQRLILAVRSSTSGREMVYRLTDNTRNIISRFLAEFDNHPPKV